MLIWQLIYFWTLQSMFYISFIWIKFEQDLIQLWVFSISCSLQGMWNTIFLVNVSPLNFLLSEFLPTPVALGMSSSCRSYQTKPKHNDAVCLAAATLRTLLNRFSQLTTVFVFCREISSKMSDSSSSSDSGDEKRERGGGY